MHIINEDGIFAKLAKQSRERRDAIRQQKQDLKDNKDKYEVFDQMIDNLRNMGYGNVELNYLQRFLMLSNSFDNQSNADMNENMLYQAAINNKLTSDKIVYLGKVASSFKNYSKEDFLWMASAGNVNQMKGLHYAHTKQIPFNEIGSFSSKPPNVNTILNVINNYDATNSKKENRHLERLSFTRSKGYDVQYLKASRYERVPDNVLADCIVASVYGKGEQEITRAVDKYLADTDELHKLMTKIAQGAGQYGGVNPDTQSKMDSKMSDVSIYQELNMPDEIPHYSLRQLSTKSSSTLQRELRSITRKKERADRRAQKVAENEPNNNQ